SAATRQSAASGIRRRIFIFAMSGLLIEAGLQARRGGCQGRPSTGSGQAQYKLAQVSSRIDTMCPLLYGTSMKPKAFFSAVLFLLILLILALAPAADAQQNKVRINWTAITGAQSGLHMAKQEKLFEKYGLDNVELIHIQSSSRGIQAILAGEIGFSFMDGLNMVQANLKGANIALVVGATNRMVFSLMAKPEFKRIADLRGKKIGITRAGSSTHTAALYALGSAGLKPGDYQVLPLLEVPNIFTALAAGQIDAGTVSPPTNSRARKAGFVELMNLAKEG